MDEKVLETLQDIRDLIRLSVRPSIDTALIEIRRIVSGSEKKLAAVLLMDGTMTKAEISKKSGYDKSDLSRLVKQLEDLGALSSQPEHPKLLFPVTNATLRVKSDDGK